MKKLFTLFSLLFVLNSCFGVITINPSTIDTGYCQHDYRFKCTATGGRAPYSYTISAGTLPTGLFLNKTTGVISGVAINYTVATSVSFTVRATDALLATGTRAYTMYIVNYSATWSNMWPIFKLNPNPHPTSANWYDLTRLYLNGDPSGLYWAQGGSTVTTIKNIGTVDSLDLPLITNNTERGRFYADGRGFDIRGDYYLSGNKFIYFPGAQTGALSMGYGAGSDTSTATFTTNVGALSLTANSSGENNSAFGHGSMRYNTSGSNNSSFGYQGLFANSTGAYNSGFGFNALSGNTTASYNSAFGSNALLSNTTGANNSAFGYEALKANLTGASNTGVGVTSLLTNTTGNYNSAIGFASMRNNTTGSENSALGYDALKLNTTGTQNTAIGLSSLTMNDVGAANSAIGVNSLGKNTSGNYNSALGERSLYNVTTGGFNTGLGATSGLTLTTGTYNTFVGYLSGDSVITGGKNTIIGALADIGNVSNNVALSDGDGNVKFRATATNQLSMVSDSVTTSVATASTNKVKIIINGTTYYFLVTTVP